MKTTLLTLCIFGFISTAFSQNIESDPSNTKSSKFTFGWVYSPEVSYRILGESDLADENTSSIIDFRNDNEQAKFGQSFSFFAGYNFSKTFTLEAGLGYTDFGEGQKPFTLVFSTGEEYATLKSTYHIHVVSVPVSLHINLGGNKVRGFISAGVAPGLFMRYTRYSMMEYSDGSTENSNSFNIGDQSNFSKFLLGAHISGGVDIKYSEKARFRIAPVFRITATDAYSEVPIKANYFNAGIEFGTIYKL